MCCMNETEVLKTRCPRCDGSGEIPTGNALRCMRKAAGITGAEMAKRCNVSPPHISDVETGKRVVLPWLVDEYRKLASI